MLGVHKNRYTSRLKIACKAFVFFSEYDPNNYCEFLPRDVSSSTPADFSVQGRQGKVGMRSCELGKSEVMGL